MTPSADVDRPDRKAIPAGPAPLAQAASRDPWGRPDRKANAVKPVRRESPARQVKKVHAAKPDRPVRYRRSSK